tara:strand:- start:279 stop:899 length:621 start_codon:yes stop_codon:yes gene_type:complete
MNESKQETINRCTREAIEETKYNAGLKAVKDLLWVIGEDPGREGLVDTPKRFVKALGEWFRGYNEDPKQILATSFSEVGGYDELVMLRRVPFESHCEHHITPIIGTATIAYLPDKGAVGVSKLARVLDCYAKRLQVQERLTAQIADALEECIKPRGVAVIVTATHQCMTTRGVHKAHSDMITSEMRGMFRDNASLRAEVMSLHLGG